MTSILWVIGSLRRMLLKAGCLIEKSSHRMSPSKGTPKSSPGAQIQGRNEVWKATYYLQRTPKKFECGCRATNVLVPSFLCSGIRGRSYSNFLAANARLLGGYKPAGSLTQGPARSPRSYPNQQSPSIRVSDTGAPRYLYRMHLEANICRVGLHGPYGRICKYGIHETQAFLRAAARSKKSSWKILAGLQDKYFKYCECTPPGRRQAISELILGP